MHTDLHAAQHQPFGLRALCVNVCVCACLCVRARARMCVVVCVRVCVQAGGTCAAAVIAAVSTVQRSPG